MNSDDIEWANKSSTIKAHKWTDALLSDTQCTSSEVDIYVESKGDIYFTKRDVIALAKFFGLRIEG